MIISNTIAMEALHNLYPEAFTKIPIFEIKGISTDKKIVFFYKALICIRNSWSKMEITINDQLVNALDCVIKAAAELFDELKDEVLNEAKPLRGPDSAAGPPPPGPPPPPSALSQRKGNSKLKKFTQMPKMFRDLKDKMERSYFVVKKGSVKETKLGGSASGKEGLAASIAEMRKRSAFFRQIEEDIVKYEKEIVELKVAVTSFQSNDMAKLLGFQNRCESVLVRLTDESQVLSKFDFPTKKLEALRTAAALYLKLETIVYMLKNWEIVSPLVSLLDKVECYLTKVKYEVEAIERNKDEVTKKLKSHDIDFDFVMLIRVKESMVDLSYRCIKLALKEWRETEKREGKKNGGVKILWRVFQLAFRIYSFAGGQDDRTYELATELAAEILAGSQNR